MQKMQTKNNYVLLIKMSRKRCYEEPGKIKQSNILFSYHAKLYLDRTSKTRRFEVSFFHGSRHIHNNKQMTHLQLKDMITFKPF